MLLVRKPKVVFATLGRLLEMVEKQYIAVDALKVLALDEADKFTHKPKSASKRTW